MISCKEYVEIEKENIKKKIDKDYILDIFQVGDNPASNAYIKGKMKDCSEVGIQSCLYKFDLSIPQQYLIDKMKQVSEKGSSGIILQLPVPKHIDSDFVIKNSIRPEQDIDGFIYDNHLPCTPRGIVDWLEFNNINLEGKNVVIIGRSDIVGKPLAKIMTNKNATITLCHSKTSIYYLLSICNLADIIVVAVGKPKWFSFKLSNKPIIIDVGINRDKDNKLCGDVDREYMEQQGCYVTPVPGGVGLLTRLALLKNIVD